MNDKLKKSLFLFLLSLIFQLPFMFFNFFLLIQGHQHDWGAQFIHTYKLLHGGIPYKDFFTYWTPGMTFIGAAIFKFLGPDFLWLRLFVVLLNSFMCVLMYLVGEKFLKSSTAFLLAVLYLPWGMSWGGAYAPYASNLTLPLAFVVIFCLFLFIGEGKEFYFILSVIMCGLIFSVKPNTGMYMLAGTLLVGMWVGMFCVGQNNFFDILNWRAWVIVVGCIFSLIELIFSVSIDAEYIIVFFIPSIAVTVISFLKCVRFAAEGKDKVKFRFWKIVIFYLLPILPWLAWLSVKMGFINTLRKIFLPASGGQASFFTASILRDTPFKFWGTFLTLLIPFLFIWRFLLLKEKKLFHYSFVIFILGLYCYLSGTTIAHTYLPIKALSSFLILMFRSVRGVHIFYVLFVEFTAIFVLFKYLLSSSSAHNINSKSMALLSILTIVHVYYFLTCFPQFLWARILWCMPLTLLLAFFLDQYVFIREKRFMFYINRYMLAVLTFAMLLQHAVQIPDHLKTLKNGEAVIFHSRYWRLFVPKPLKDRYEYLRTVLQSQPDFESSSIYLFSNIQLPYIYLGKIPRIPAYSLFRPAVGKREESKIIKYLSSDDVRYVITVNMKDYIAGYPYYMMGLFERQIKNTIHMMPYDLKDLAGLFPDIMHYIRSNFVPFDSKYGFTLWKKRGRFTTFSIKKRE